MPLYISSIIAAFKKSDDEFHSLKFVMFRFGHCTRAFHKVPCKRFVLLIAPTAFELDTFIRHLRLDEMYFRFPVFTHQNV